MQPVGAVDMGSSGARVARVAVTATGAELVSEVTGIPKTAGRRAFRRALRDAIGDVAALGIAIAGPTDPTTGEVLFAGAWPWAQGDLAGRLGAKMDLPVAVVNDAEAHLVAHLDHGPHPLVCLAVGTGLGFAMTDDTGTIRRPRSDANWELGHLRVLRSVDATVGGVEDKAVLALSGRGLDTLRARHGRAGGTDAFTIRMANFVHEIALIFQPRSVVFTGGVTTGLGTTLVTRTRQILDERWPTSVRWEPPTVSASPHGGTSALIGAAIAATEQVPGLISPRDGGPIRRT